MTAIGILTASLEVELAKDDNKEKSRRARSHLQPHGRRLLSIEDRRCPSSERCPVFKRVIFVFSFVIALRLAAIIQAAVPHSLFSPMRRPESTDV